jgi:hypothetical protein
MDTDDFKEAIKPFFWVGHANSYSVCLNAGNYKSEVFMTRVDEGCEGNSYDWTSLAKIFIEERHSELKDTIKFDPEGSMFCAYSCDKAALEKFILSFKIMCEDTLLIQDLFLKAELD